MTPDDIKNTPLKQLAEQRYGLDNNHPDSILIDNEIERRKRSHQHELDLDLVAKQVRWMKWSTLATVAAALIGATVGALVTFWLQHNPQPRQPESPTQPAQQQSGELTSVDRTEKAVSTVPPKNTP